MERSSKQVLTPDEIIKIIEQHNLWLKYDNMGKRADFSNSCIENMHIENENLQNAIFDNAEFNNTDFYNTDFSGSTFNNTVIASNSKFDRCNFNCVEANKLNTHSSSMKQCTFNKATFLECKFTLTDLYKSSMKHSNFSFSTFKDVRLRSSKIESCVFNATDFINSDLSQADFSRTKLLKARFEKSNLVRAIFFGAQMKGIKIIKSNVIGTCFNGALTDRKIIQLGPFGKNIEYIAYLAYSGLIQHYYWNGKKYVWEELGLKKFKKVIQQEYPPGNPELAPYYEEYINTANYLATIKPYKKPDDN